MHRIAEACEKFLRKFREGSGREWDAMAKGGKKIPKAQARRLIEGAGRWKDFVAWRHGLRAVGVPSVRAWALSIEFVERGLPFPAPESYAGTGEIDAERAANESKTLVPHLNRPKGAKRAISDPDAKSGGSENGVPGVPVPPVGPPPIPDSLRGKKSRTIEEDVKWVYENIMEREPDVASCPSAGAWGMWQWASATQFTREEFYKSFAKSTMTSKSGADAAFQKHDDDRKLLEVLEDEALQTIRQEGIVREDDECPDESLNQSR